MHENNMTKNKKKRDIHDNKLKNISLNNEIN